MLKCQKCRELTGAYDCRHDVVGTPRKDQEIVGYSEVKEGLLRLIKDSFQRSRDSSLIANLSAALIGDFGMGKSAMAHFFVDAINASSYELILVTLLEDGVDETTLTHFDTNEMAGYRGAAIHIDAREVASGDLLTHTADLMTPFFKRIGDLFDVPRANSSVKDIVKAVLEKSEATRLFVFIDELEALKETQYGLDFDQFFARFTNDLRTLVNGEGMYDVHNSLTIVVCTVPNVWEEFRRREDIAGGLLTREYSEPFLLQRFTLDQSYRFVDRVCRSWSNSPFSERCVRTLHLVADGRPRLLTKLCKHVEGHLPSGEARDSDSFQLASLTTTALRKAVGSQDQAIYAFDPTSYQQLGEYLGREFSPDHASVLSLLVGEYGEYSDDEIALKLGLRVALVHDIIGDLSSDDRPVLGLRLISKGHVLDYANLATERIPKIMVERRFVADQDVEITVATGTIAFFGKLEYYRQVLGQLAISRSDGRKCIFVSFHKDDLALIWNLDDRQADALGKGLRGSVEEVPQTQYRLSEAARNRIFPVASQADLPFLSKDQYYRLRNRINGLDDAQRRANLTAGALKLVEHQGYTTILPRTAVESFDFEVSRAGIGSNDDRGAVGRVLVIDSAELFDESDLCQALEQCDFGLLLSTRNYGGNRVLIRSLVNETSSPYCPTIVRLIRTTRLETNLLILGLMADSDIVVSSEYAPTLARLSRELGLESVMHDWIRLGYEAGTGLKAWQMRRDVSRQDARDTLSDLIRVTPSMPLSLESAREIYQKELGFPATALPSWKGIEDLVDLGYVTQRKGGYDLVLSPTETAVLQTIAYQKINSALFTDRLEELAEELQGFFWNFTTEPKSETLKDYLTLLLEKGLLVPRTAERVRQENVDFNRLYDQASVGDNYGSSVKQYCDYYSRTRRRRGLEGVKRSQAYLFRNYRELADRAVRPEEVRKRDYCASALIGTYEALAELYQEGESRYKAAKVKLDEAARDSAQTKQSAKLVMGAVEIQLAIAGETDKSWQTIENALAELINVHRDGSADVERIAQLSQQIAGQCENLRRTFQAKTATVQNLQEKYRGIYALAQSASQSPYRDQVKSEIQQVSDADPAKEIPRLLDRYATSGAAAGDSLTRNYETRLEGLTSTLRSFLNQQERLRNLAELLKNTNDLLKSLDEKVQELEGSQIAVEEMDRIDSIPAFYRLSLAGIKQQAETLRVTVREEQGKYAYSGTNVATLRAQLDDLHRALQAFGESQTNFSESIRQINYKIRALFSPLHPQVLNAACDKVVRDVHFQAQKLIQGIFRVEASSEASLGCKSVITYLEQCEQVLKELSGLDSWLSETKRIFDAANYRGLAEQARADALARRLQETEESINIRLPVDLGQAFALLQAIQRDERPLCGQTLAEIRLAGEQECADRIDEARRMAERFEAHISDIRAELNAGLESSVLLRRDAAFAQSLDKTRSVVDQLIAHIERVQGSRSVGIQVALLLKPEMTFPQLVVAYGQRFAVEFDEEAATELLRLIREGKVNAKFSI